MLQQILTDMFIEPELLAELNEEQKQVLFFKMRQEQVRRWREREAKLEKEEVMQKPKKGDQRVSWMLGKDSDVWVWVMGEHPKDKPYEKICDEIMAERATLQAQREGEELRAKKEAELEKRFSNVHLDPELLSLKEQEERSQEEARLEQVRQEKARQEELARQEEQRQEQARQAAALEQSRLEELKRREAEERSKAEEEVRRLEEERAQEIYMDLKKVQGQEKEDKHWQETLRKSKAADQRRRSMAKQTREDHRRRSVKALERGRVAAVTKAFGGEKPALPPKPKPRNLTVTSDALNQKPGMRRSLSTSSREHIIRWFQEEQLPLRAGFQKDQSCIAPWFHGIISREEAEALLSECGPGHFLVRVSERILGYVISYRCQEGYKHFLVDATENCYMLLGDQLKFTSLIELVEYHEGEPITSLGEERLLSACGQKPGSVDYADLFT